MIRGTGTDIVNAARIKKLMDEHGARFLKKILSSAEIELIPEVNAELFVAGRFAAKEALFKATGVQFSMSSVSVLNESSGKPFFFGDAMEKISGGGTVHLSISHDSDYAVAFVVIETV
ncbi:MAG TPA: holo-ACP synthase [Spirochaetota bacterium]|nr:holo-ACP synthase [Spirochaetota bacterium]HQO40092.1 holo-ACP synthase [Spirochaetota bacterium]